MSIEGKTEPIQTQVLASCCLVPGLNIVPCSLKELPLHCPSCASDATVHNGVSSSSQRRKSSRAPGLPPADVFAQLTVEQIVMSRKPTLIDRLISQNKTALIMESRARRRAAKQAKEDTQVNGKRKSNSTEEHIQRKKLRSSKNDIKKNVQKKVLPPPSRKKKIDSDPTPSTNRYATRISMNKVRIPFSLRSGRKMADILKSKRKRVLKQQLQQNDTEKKLNQVDSNSNTFAGGEPNDDKMKAGEIKPKRKRRKRCSMWVKKVKRPSRKVEDLPVLNKVESEEEDQETEIEEESEPLMPTLVKEVDHRDIKLKSEEIKNESSDVSLQNKDSLLEDIPETKSCEITTKLSTVVENEHVLVESNLEIKTEETPDLSQDSHQTVFSEEQSDKCDTDISCLTLDKQNISSQEIIGTKEDCFNQLIMENKLLEDSCKNSISEIVESMNSSLDFDKTDTEEVCNVDATVHVERIENSKAEIEIIETEIKSRTEGTIIGDGQKFISENADAIRDEDLLETKGLKMFSNIDVCETELNENVVTDFQNRDQISCESISCEDVTDINAEKLENGDVNIKHNPTFVDNLGLTVGKVDESEDVEHVKKETIVNDDRNSKSSTEEKEEVQNKDIQEEIHPSEADSTSDVNLVVLCNSENEHFRKSEMELKLTSGSEISILPDSTKEVKSISPEIKLEKEEIASGNTDSFSNTEENKETSINDLESESIKLHTNDESENQDKIEEINLVDGKISVEQKQMKESVLQALGLKSLSAAPEHKQHCDEDKQKCVQQLQQQQRNNAGYTGTLKAVIKLNRTGDKKRTMVYKRNEDALSTSDKLEYRICSDFPSTESVPITHLAEMGYNRKNFHHKNTESVTNSVYVNSSNNSSSHSEEAEVNGEDAKGNKESNLIIPEKSSSFSIHPGRLCSDVCSYCFGKFGSLDTPCHVAQIKGEERQKKILQNEPHLTPESCLCDACYRYVDRKVNYHPKTGGQQGTNSNSTNKSQYQQPQPQASCCVVMCSQSATHTIKRKWILKLKKNLTNKLDIDMDKHTGIYFPFCTQHHYWVEYLTVCGICRKRLNRNNLFSLGREADRLNLMLAEDGIPARLSDNLFLCKLCRYYSNLRLKYSDTSAIPSQNKAFYKSYRRKILMSLDIAVSNSEDECENSEDASTPEKKRGISTSTVALPRKATHGNNVGGCTTADNLAGGSSSNNENTSDEMVSLSELATLLGEQPEQQQTRIQVKFGNVNIGTLSNLNIGQQGGGPASVTGTADKEGPESGLTCRLDFKGPTTPDGPLERCTTTIQFDKKAKQLWTDLQKPYGSQTMFLRHLIMMEKIWRDGHLILSSTADEKAIKYVLNAKNKVRISENSSASGNIGSGSASPVNSVQVRPIKPKEVNQSNPPPIRIRQQLQQPLQSQLKVQPHHSPQLQHQQKQERFPLLPNTGEIEVTPIRTTAQPQTTVHQSSPITVTTSLQHQHQQYMRPTSQQPQRSNLHQMTSTNQPTNVLQQQLMSRKLTPLDRAKSLVRMAPPQQRPPPPRYYVPAQNSSIGQQQYYSGGSSTSRAPPPPLMKLQSYYQHQQQLNQQSAVQHPYQLHHHVQQQPRTILPKLPKSLTVVSRMNSKPTAITLRHSGITIEKQSSVPPLRSSLPLPVEKPIISVFREPAISPQHH